MCLKNVLCMNPWIFDELFHWESWWLYYTLNLWVPLINLLLHLLTHSQTVLGALKNLALFILHLIATNSKVEAMVYLLPLTDIE